MHKNNSTLVLLRGGGDLATGVALRLFRSGLHVLITELPQPLAVRRTVSFAEAVYEGRHTVEGVTAHLVEPEQIPAALAHNEIPVLIDPDANVLTGGTTAFAAVVDGRLTKQVPAPLPVQVPLHVGLGPGFQAGINCDAVIETRRSHTLGRVYWNGSTQPDSGQPEGDRRRVLRAPRDGLLTAVASIGAHLEEGQLIAQIDQQPVVSPFKGVLRGLIRPGIPVTEGLKIGDIDPRDDTSACFLVSDKALSIGGAVLEALFSREEIRAGLWR